MMARTYRVGIAGSGFGASTHLPAFTAHPRFEVVALASPNRAARIAKDRGVPHAFESTRAMVEGCAVDVVSIATPPFAHHDDVLVALAAGKHVVCEKPFALSIEQARHMRDAAFSAGTACAVMHEFRWVPQRQAIKELIVNGHLAPLRDIEMTQLSTSLRASRERERGWWFDRERGGGLAGAALSHHIDSATWLVGRRPMRSTGMIRTANVKRADRHGEFQSAVDDGAFALLDYGDGVVARLSCDGTTSVDTFTLAVHAENRTAVASGSSVAGDVRLFAVDADETSELECKPSRYAKFESINGNVPLVMELLDEFVRHIAALEAEARRDLDEADALVPPHRGFDGLMGAGL